MNKTEFDIAIVGGGLVGASLALALAPKWRVVLIERAVQQLPSHVDTDWDNRIYAISPGSQTFLRSLGVWPPVRAGVIRQMDVRGDAGGAIHFDALDLAADALATTVENRSLQSTLWQALAGRVELINPAELQAVRFGADAVQLTLADGRELSTKLAVAADGAHSWLREKAGIPFSLQPYHQCGVVANFDCERPHGDIARQWFRADGILAWLPLPANRISIVWSTNDEHANELKALSPTELAQRVAAAGGRVLGSLHCITPAAAFPLALGRAAKVNGLRLALVGDAAHTVHPLAGQGVNLGFGDAKALAGVLNAAVGRDPGDAHLLARYARSRAEDVLRMQMVCDGLQKLFSLQYPLLRPLRNLGLNLTDGAGPLKRLLMQQAFR
ncbi:UbiH/UbiF family hydroxylase [Chitinimonas sp. BJB300]|uniref:UbiH/UbiF family hydroxylase n=1 Tax=Chitinimonas sp. BJB300 TaxID=1559339 RepID=UPI000C0D5BD3|nr:UbiH/UbiF family hydroxylase [Chitinimonas sp. BJB300]PHV12212.1 ubiquinone biosynthesis protein UbiH [Chitinimonas sp. BJB300]TSJ91617.1 UbiH/UbiF family hydroxylase [Chitinimonas sp. BJB300]